MKNTAPADWSPADNPYAIALSESQWSMRTARLAILRMRDGDDHRSSFSSRQIDARQLVFALRQLLTAEQLQQVALRSLEINPAAGDALSKAKQRFEEALPGIKDMRDALMHFDEWSRGEGRGPQKERRKAGEAPRDVARMYSGFAYDPSTGSVSLGPYSIHIDAAEDAACELADAIYMAGREIDKRNATDLHTRTTQAITEAGLSCSSPEAVIKVLLGPEPRTWLSLSSDANCDEDSRQQLSERIVTAIANAGLHLVSSTHPQSQDAAERLTQGEFMYVESRL